MKSLLVCFVAVLTIAPLAWAQQETTPPPGEAIPPQNPRSEPPPSPALEKLTPGPHAFTGLDSRRRVFTVNVDVEQVTKNKITATMSFSNIYNERVCGGKFPVTGITQDDGMIKFGGKGAVQGCAGMIESALAPDGKLIWKATGPMGSQVPVDFVR